MFTHAVLWEKGGLKFSPLFVDSEGCFFLNLDLKGVCIFSPLIISWCFRDSYEVTVWGLW